MAFLTEKTFIQPDYDLGKENHLLCYDHRRSLGRGLTEYHFSHSNLQQAFIFDKFS